MPNALPLIAMLLTQPAPSDGTEAPKSWTEHASLEIEFTASVWAPRLDGHVEFGGGRIDIDDDLSLLDHQAVPRLELTLRAHDWHFQADAFTFSVDGTEPFERFERFGSLLLRPGDQVRSDIDLQSAGFEARYVFKRSLQTPIAGRRPSGLQIFGSIGARVVDVEQDMRLQTGAREKAEGTWGAVTFGGGIALHLDESIGWPIGKGFVLNVSGGMGPTFGDGSGYVWQISADGRVAVTDHVDLVFGYRLLEVDADSGSYTFDAGLQGLIFGAAVRF